ncbi:hypothetical protein DAH66_12770 [Sphingomonas koreensis]|uniref:Gene product 88 domain-containing protein n=1 Tax=Sphingomonas koreensis TaxID=93064 RepID=A0A430G2D8_9SPHN|nr:hypothetical protein [Sphingomonas koreensis]RSY83136.1 hypothetical protein DAH66_12770 [Sphingomonas koreensis]
MIEPIEPAQPRKGYGHGGSLRRFESIEPGGRRRELAENHPAVVEGRTIMPGRVFQPHEVARLLIDGVNSRKIGRRVMKGRWKGFPIFTLTLEERATCPRTCLEWRTCYGGNMQYARRIAHGADYERRLWAELAEKQRKHPGGFAVRLHVLGDFYSETYVRLWRNALERFPALHVFGFTARDPIADPIGTALYSLIVVQWRRFAIRFSGLDAPEGGSVVIDRDQPTPHIVCPAQTGGTDCCATCALCWHSDRTIAFWRH